MHQSLYQLKQKQTLVFSYLGLFAILFAALWWRLKTLVPGYSPAEQATFQSGFSLREIAHNPVNAPFLVLERGLIKLHPVLFNTRIASVLFATSLLVIFCWLAKRWYGHHAAILATLLFGLSSGFLHIARLGTPEILLCGLFVLLALGYRMENVGSRGSVTIAVLFATALLYVPGMVWFIALGIFWRWKTIDKILKHHTIVSALVSLLVVVGLMPIAWAVYHNHTIAWQLLGFPNHWPAITTALQNIALAPFHLFIYNHQTSAARWLNDAPLLDVFTLAMFMFGTYKLYRSVGSTRRPLLISLILLSFVLIGLGGRVTLAIVLPFIYIIAACGLHHFMDQWFKTFPRNPIARSLGWFAISVVVALACSYHLWQYFVGWPHARATTRAFSIKQE